MNKLYYISQGKSSDEHLKNIESVCKAGVKLIQLRLKNVSLQEYISVGKQAKMICDNYNATLIINDNIEVAKVIDADGVHLGKEDDSIIKAKLELPNKLIGGTANTLEDCLALIKNGVNYIGLGPFKFTETKKKLSPILGEEGYKSIISELKKQGVDIPIYAIGGITTDHFEQLFDVGIYGMAVSGLLTDKNEETIKDIVSRIKRLRMQ